MYYYFISDYLILKNIEFMKISKQLGHKYSHPLIKDIEKIENESHSKFIYSYENFKPNNLNGPSQKFVRITNSVPSINSYFSVLLQPFNSNIDSDLSLINQCINCQSCGSYANPCSKANRNDQISCSICGCIYQAKNLDKYQKQLTSFIIDEEKMFDGVISSGSYNKKICFCIEASQYNYEAQVHLAVLQVIKSFPQLYVAFVFFTNEYILFLNLDDFQLIKYLFLQQQFTSKNFLHEIPIEQESMFKKASDIILHIDGIINQIMYEAFYIKKTILNVVVQMVNATLSSKVEVKYFITTLESSMDQKKNRQKNVFIQKRNIRQISLNSNSQYYVILLNVLASQSISSLEYCVGKLYHPQKNGHFKQIYYDLFESLNRKSYINTIIKVKYGKSFQINICQNIKNIQILGQLQKQNYKECELLVKKGSKNTIISIQFEVKSLQNKYFQFIVNFESYKRIINVKLQDINRESNTKFIDDEAYFYDFVNRQLSIEKDISVIKQNMKKQIGGFVPILKQNATSESIDIPINLKHLFLYSYLFEQYPAKQRYQQVQFLMLKYSSLNSLMKKLYFRTYRLDQGKIKNIKFSLENIKKHSICFLQNSQNIYMIFNNPSVKEIKDIFGLYDTIDQLRQRFMELPQLETNYEYINAIQTIRNQNQSNYLVLKLIEMNSGIFQDEIVPFLYRKDFHFSYLKSMWQAY